MQEAEVNLSLISFPTLCKKVSPHPFFFQSEIHVEPFWPQGLYQNVDLLMQILEAEKYLTCWLFPVFNFSPFAGISDFNFHLFYFSVMSVFL